MNEQALWQAVVEKEKVEHELEIGRQIQQSFLPRTLTSPDGWDVAIHFQAARQVAGDFYDLFAIESERRVAFFLGDVCDKGVGAALFMALFRSLLRAFADQHYGSGLLPLLEDVGASGRQNIPAPGVRALTETVNRTNEYVTRHHGHTTMFTTLFFGLLDPRSGALSYVNGGQEPAVIIGAKGGVRAALGPTGPVVGLLPGLSFRSAEAALAPGETLLIFSDGLTEAQGADDELFGVERVRALLAEPVTDAATLLARLTAAATSFAGSQPQADDLTLMALRRRA